MPLTDGDQVPAVTFKCRVRDETIGGPNPFTFKDVTTSDIMAGKRIVLFAVPGAFTPTCSDLHLPGYEKVRRHGLSAHLCLPALLLFTPLFFLTRNKSTTPPNNTPPPPPSLR